MRPKYDDQGERIFEGDAPRAYIFLVFVTFGIFIWILVAEGMAVGVLGGYVEATQGVQSLCMNAVIANLSLLGLGLLPSLFSKKERHGKRR